MHLVGHAESHERHVHRQSRKLEHDLNTSAEHLEPSGEVFVDPMPADSGWPEKISLERRARARPIGRTIPSQNLHAGEKRMEL
jgi:hypothetical protein